jgi:ABC-type multidrug transport system fused ATPase/permease subunit
MDGYVLPLLSPTLTLTHLTLTHPPLFRPYLAGAEKRKPTGWLGDSLHLPIADGHATLYAMVYLTLCFVNSVFAATRTQFPAYMGGLAAKRAFRKLITCVIHSPMLFFESTPTGRLLNRFTNDTECAPPLDSGDVAWCCERRLSVA